MVFKPEMLTRVKSRDTIRVVEIDGQSVRQGKCQCHERKDKDRSTAVDERKLKRQDK